ncbi:hypothetical protein NDU88_005459 [Pleurodeles waltl]|uniref:Uncharacterized protein n=1 Tax=Pleurodeles waltl TaxID=8319 RepID=A0AAV7MWC9_PLEWA|nr:hypothetical protein NDU88_005459 [Pleurodeles waltl]
MLVVPDEKHCVHEEKLCAEMMHLLRRCWWEWTCVLLEKNPWSALTARERECGRSWCADLRGRACRRPRPRAQAERRADVEARNRFRRACRPGEVECLGAGRRLSRAAAPAAHLGFRGPGALLGLRGPAVLETFLDLAALGILCRRGRQELLGSAGPVTRKAVCGAGPVLGPGPTLRGRGWP